MTAYVNVKNGQISTYQMGDRARGPLLPAHDLSDAGAHITDGTPFHTTPPGARSEVRCSDRAALTFRVGQRTMRPERRRLRCAWARL